MIDIDSYSMGHFLLPYMYIPYTPPIPASINSLSLIIFSMSLSASPPAPYLNSLCGEAAIP